MFPDACNGPNVISVIQCITGQVQFSWSTYVVVPDARIPPPSTSLMHKEHLTRENPHGAIPEGLDEWLEDRNPPQLFTLLLRW